MEWFRLYQEVARDPKLKRAARLLGQPFAQVLGIWTVVLCYAGDSPVRGGLWLAPGVPVTEDDIAEAAGCNVAETLRLFQSFAMLAQNEAGAFEVVSWDHRQYASDSSTARVREHRQRKKAAVTPPEPAGQPPGETLPQRPGNAPETDTETDLTLPAGRDAQASPAPTPAPTPTPALAPTPTQAPTPAQAPAPTPGPGKKPRPPNAHYELAVALGEVCGIELAPNKGRLVREAALLKAANPPPTPEEVRLRYGHPHGWWWAHDWRGQRGEYPCPATLRETWGRWLKPTPTPPRRNGHATTGLATAGSTPEPDDAAAIAAARERYARRGQPPAGAPA